jgi:hypothetical protein
MPFSASTCLTNAGSTPLGPVLSAYTDTDSYLNPFSSVLLTQITGSSCPYVFTGIPDGTTNIRLIDPTNSCCITIPIQSDNFCDTCDLDFTTYPLNTNSQIIAGDLTGSCQGNISDYVINWFGPNSATNIAFRSGKGNTFSYQFTHPLTGSGFVFAQAGTYTPVIDRVIISGITFSNTGGTGTYDATLDCFNNQQVQVNPLTCDNGNTPTSVYTHSYYFSGTGSSSIPLNVTFQLSANTNYFAYSFTGQTVPDRLKITYSGGTTPSEVILENMSVGSSNTNQNFSWSAPRVTAGSSIKKVLCLTGLTRIPGDFVTIQIVPNPGNTEWSLNLRCLSSFDCNPCQQQYIQSNTPYRIIASSITAITSTCFTQISLRLSGCSGDQSFNTDIDKYMPGTVAATPFNRYFVENVTFGVNGIIPSPASSAFGLQSSERVSYNLTDCFIMNFSFPTANSNNCIPNPTPGTIFFSKFVQGAPSVGIIQIEFNNTFWLNHYYSSYLNTMNSISTWGISGCTATGTTTNNGSFFPGWSSSLDQGAFSGGTSANNIPSYLDPQDIRYYRSFTLCLPSSTGSSSCFSNTSEICPAGNCGFIGNSPNGLSQCYRIHPSAIVTTGITGSNYFMRIVMSTVSKNIQFTSCQQNCINTSDNFINSVNNSSTGTTNNISFTTTSPSVFSNPFSTSSILNYDYTLTGISNSFSAQCRTVSRYSRNLGLQWYDYMNYTIPQNPSTNAALTNYSATTCPNFRRWQNPINFTQPTSAVAINSNLALANFYVQLLNEPVNGPPIPPANTAFTQVYRNYEIYCLPIVNGVIAGNTTPPANDIGAVNPTVTNPNWVLAYRYRFPPSGTGQEVCNSTYVIC